MLWPTFNGGIFRIPSWCFRASNLQNRNIPIGSMYGIFTYIYHRFMPNVGKYTIHGSYGICTQLNTWKTRLEKIGIGRRDIFPFPTFGFLDWVFLVSSAGRRCWFYSDLVWMIGFLGNLQQHKLGIPRVASPETSSKKKSPWSVPTPTHGQSTRLT